MSTSTTFGRAIGAAIGMTAAYAGHTTISAACYTGRFGADIVGGATEGYTAKAAELRERREAARLEAPIKVAVSRTAKA